MNWSFLQAGMVDELSLFLAPVTDGGCGTASLFTQIQPLTEGEPVEFLLREIEQIGGRGLRLNYQPQKQKDIKMIGGEAMKVLLANGSPHKEGCTYTALCEVADTLNKEGIETEIFLDWQ